MINWFFWLLIRARFPARPYYWLLDRLTDNNGWRPLDMREPWGAYLTAEVDSASTCDHYWAYFAGVGAVGFEDGYECRKCGGIR